MYCRCKTNVFVCCFVELIFKVITIELVWRFQILFHAEIIIKIDRKVSRCNRGSSPGSKYQNQSSLTLRARATTQFRMPCAPVGILDFGFSLSPESDSFVGLIARQTFLGPQIITGGGSHCV